MSGNIAFNTTEPTPDELSLKLGKLLLEQFDWIDISYGDDVAYGVVVQVVRNLLAEENT